MRELTFMKCLGFAPLALLVPAAASAIVMASIGCGGSEFAAGAPDASPEASTLTAEQACSDSAHQRCTRLQQCSPTQMAVLYVDEGTCETQLKLSCLNALSAEDTGNDAQATEACALAYPSISCDDLLDDVPAAACLQQKGSRADGATCGFPGQCASGFCAIVPGGQCGTCAAIPKAGDPCTKLTTCGQALSCWSTTLLCTTFAAVNQPCNKGQPCGGGLYCVGSTSTLSGACQPSVESKGASCDWQGKSGPGCDRNALLACDGETQTCATLQLAAAGAPCGTVNEQLVVCGGAGLCTPVDAGAPTPVGDGGPTTATASETCVAAARDGDPCDLVAGPACITPARCILTTASLTAGTCQFADPAKCN